MTSYGTPVSWRWYTWARCMASCACTGYVSLCHTHTLTHTRTALHDSNGRAAGTFLVCCAESTLHSCLACRCVFPFTQAKKILEWSASPEEAIEVPVYGCVCVCVGILNTYLQFRVQCQGPLTSPSTHLCLLCVVAVFVVVQLAIYLNDKYELVSGHTALTCQHNMLCMQHDTGEPGI